MGLEVRNCTLHRVCLSLLDRYSQVSPRTSDTLVPFISWHISSGVSVTLENNSCVDSLKKRVTHIFEVAATFIAMKHFSKMKKNTQSCMKDYIFAAGKSRNTLSLSCWTSMVRSSTCTSSAKMLWYCSTSMAAFSPKGAGNIRPGDAGEP